MNEITPAGERWEKRQAELRLTTNMLAGKTISHAIFENGRYGSEQVFIRFTDGTGITMVGVSSHGDGLVDLMWAPSNQDGGW